ncbi:sulfatase [Planctomycetes bacterium K23_9]|uniref:Arylsulfatase n=1 Tax=Stieleria marina TaxID=1930275 RepID=A0A517NWZ4_9BACT|nr:Arylsulfatase [Planctomycetes bacterium K23_9]
MKLFAVVGFALVFSAMSVQADRPNIILLMGDDHGWDETGYNGHPHLQTPILDQMAATGLRLDRFYSAHPTCSPTRGSVMTGRHPNRYGTFTPGFSIRPQEITVAHLMHDAGYRCGHFGKWHLGPVKKTSPTNPGAMGFDEWLSHDNFFELDPVLSRNGGPPKKFPGESSEVIIAETIQFLDQTRKQDTPFFAVVWFGSPHEPYSGLEKDLSLYDDIPAKYAGKSVKLTSNETGRPTKRPLGDVLRERYAEITAMDRSIGTLRDWLSDHQLRDDTLLWYCGDNGTSSDGIVTSPFRGRKGNVYGGGIRVPGVIEWPNRIKTPAISQCNAVTSDILPTLCQVTQSPLPDRPLDGVSLVPVMVGSMSRRKNPIGFWNFAHKGDAKNEPVFDPVLQQGTTPLVKMMGDLHTRNFRNYHHPEIKESDFNGELAWLGDQYKLIANLKSNGKAKYELFDVRADPSESDDLVKKLPAVADEMKLQLHAWQQSVLESLTAADYK